MTVAEVAQELGISRQHQQRIQHRALLKVRAGLRTMLAADP
jgi:DNA-directed RNA polymerase specialized sigma subunit